MPPLPLVTPPLSPLGSGVPLRRMMAGALPPPPPAGATRSVLRPVRPVDGAFGRPADGWAWRAVGSDGSTCEGVPGAVVLRGAAVGTPAVVRALSGLFNGDGT
jgi:hypothetical protein